jgi:hypothetical protein
MSEEETAAKRIKKDILLLFVDWIGLDLTRLDWYLVFVLRRAHIFDEYFSP